MATKYCLFSRLIDGEFPLPMNEAIFPEGGPAAIRNLETDPILRIQDPDETDSWQAACNRRNESGFIHGLGPLQIKRQEHIYEFILTESNHCQVLKVVEKVRDLWSSFSFIQTIFLPIFKIVKKGVLYS